MRSKIRCAAACLAAFFLLSGLPVMPASAQECDSSIKIKIRVYLEGALSSLGVLKADAQDLNPGDMFQEDDCPECPLMAVVPAGEFQMGSPDSEGGEPDETPVHRVEIKKFAAGVCEVTFAEYDACVDAGGCPMPKPNDQRWGRGTRPVINVSWNDASSYTAWLSEKTGEEYRLLTESEWEYAARAGTTARYSFGDAVTTDQANYLDSGFGRTVPVGSYEPNAFGLHDVHGNVEEWTADCWHAGYDSNNDGTSDAPADGSAWLEAGEGDCSLRVLRSGSWGVSPLRLRSADRNSYGLDVRRRDLGFRVARTLSP